MPFVIYQLGDVPLYHTMVGASGKAVQVDTPREWRYPTNELFGVGGSVSYLPLTRSLPQTPQIKINGTIQATAPYPITRTLNALKAISGRRNIPLIGFQLENAMEEGDNVSAIQWLSTKVTVTDVDDSVSYNETGNAWAFDLAPINMTLKADIAWRALSPWLWEYRDPMEFILNPYDDANSQVGFDNYFSHPHCLSDLRECFYFYRWQDTLTRYNPTFWGLRYTEGLLGGYGSDFTDFGTYQFYSDPHMWSAEPLSVYAFTGLQPTGSISITVKKATGLFAGQYRNEVSELDLDQLDTDMAAAGYGGLLESDIIFTGALAPFPGFVQRSGEKLTGFSPRWSYEGAYPGEGGIGYNTTIFSSEGTSGQVAFLHEYGVL